LGAGLGRPASDPYLVSWFTSATKGDLAGDSRIISFLCSSSFCWRSWIISSGGFGGSVWGQVVVISLPPPPLSLPAPCWTGDKIKCWEWTTFSSVEPATRRRNEDPGVADIFTLPSGDNSTATATGGGGGPVDDCFVGLGRLELPVVLVPVEPACPRRGIGDGLADAGWCSYGGSCRGWVLVTRGTGLVSSEPLSE